MPLTVPPPDTPGPSTATPIGALGLLATTPSARSAGYSWGFLQESKTLPAYTSAPIPGPFSGGLLDLLSAARLADLNTTRNALENLRVFAENTARQHNQLCRDLIEAGIIGQ